MNGAINARRAAALIGLAILAALPFVTPGYFLHLLIQALLWGFIYTAWALMGRFGFVSLGHGAFLGVGAYVPALLWNYEGVTPWIGIPLSVALAVLLALVIGYPCFRLKVVGHYFALVTLALGQIVLLSIVAARDVTGGSLGMTQKTVGHSWYALQFPEKGYFYAIALLVWLGGLAVWHWIDRGIGREALEAISEDEEAAAAVGIDVLREKLRVIVISAALTAFGGAIFGQYLMYLNPETVSGIAVSLQIVFAAIAGGMYAMLGPTIGAFFTLALTEGLRVWFGASFVGAANTIYGILLILFIIFMPRGIVGLIGLRPSLERKRDQSMNTRVLCLALFAGCALGATPEGLHAQAGNYPTRPITLIVPFAPGGATDIVARIISLKLGKDLGQNLVVENRTGAGGNLGAAAAAKADPDGHTLALMTTGNVVINPFLYKTMPLDPFTDLVPVAVVADGPEVIAVNAALGVNSLGEFIAAARAKSGTFTYGSAGTGTIPHLGGDLLARLIGTKMVHVPFRGSAAAMKEVATGEIQFSIATHASAEPFVAAGKVKILAVAHPRRLSSLPDIPTTAEAGLPGFELSNWFGVMAPRGTNPDIIALLNAKLQSMFDDPANVALLTRQGIEPVRDTAQGFAERIAKEAKVWKEIVAGSGLQLE